MTEMQLLADVSLYVDDHGWVRSADVEAHRIAALVTGGMSEDEILRAYPGLDAAQVEAAVLYARANPSPNRVYPRRAAKSAAYNATGGGLGEAFEAARGPDNV